MGNTDSPKYKSLEERERIDPNVEAPNLRLRLIRHRLGLSMPEFAELIGAKYQTVHQMEKGATRVLTAYMKLAELELAKFNAALAERDAKRREQRRQKAGPTLAADEQLRREAVKLYCLGKTREQICTELAIRPEAVDFYLEDIEE